MYITLICFFILSIVFCVFGKIFILYCDKKSIDNYSISDIFFIGLCVVGSFLNIWSVFLPTNSFALFFLLSSTLFIIYIKKNLFLIYSVDFFKKITSEKFFLILVIISTLIVLLFSIIIPRNYDSYLYHINAIQWNEMYRAVPGLANFHDRFGFNSSMFVLSAGLCFNALYNQYIFIISSLSFYVFFIWLLKYIYFKKGSIGLFSLLFIYFFTQQYGFDISSPGTDLLPNIFVSYILISLLFDNQSLERKKILFIIIPFFCITLKLSTFPILIIALIAISFEKKEIFFKVKQLIIFGFIFILPWVIRNLIISGYVLYPLEKLDFFNFDWKVPKENVIITKNWVYSWARIPMKDYHIVLNMTFQQWFQVWWKAAVQKNHRFFILAAAAPIVFGLYAIIYRKEKNSNLTIAVFVAYVSFLLWLFTAPDFRFSFSFILFLSLLPIFVFKRFIKRIEIIFNPILISSLLYSLFLIGCDGYKLFSEDYSLSKPKAFLYLPKDVYFVKEKQDIQFLEKFYFTPNNKKLLLYGPAIINTQCFDKFPCAPLLDDRFQLRGENLQDGFTSGSK